MTPGRGDQEALRSEQLGGERVRRRRLRWSRCRPVSSRESDRPVETRVVSKQQVAEFMGQREPLRRQPELRRHEDATLFVVDGDERAPQLVQRSEQQRDIPRHDRSDDVEARAGSGRRFGRTVSDAQST